MSRLDALYTQERLWPDLLENLKLQAGSATDDHARKGLKKRIAALYSDELQDAHAALETYREVIETGYDREAAAAIQYLGEHHDDLRASAADALEPVLRSASMYSDLAAILELRLRAQTEAGDRARTLRALAEVAEVSLNDLNRAEAALLRALAEEPQDVGLHAEIERIAERTGQAGWQRYADVLSERSAGIFDANVAADLFVRLGRISEDKLDDPAKAAQAYVSAAERMGDDPAVLAALDRLFSRLGDTRALGDVLERRIALEKEATAQADLWHRLASLQIGEFGVRSQGPATLRPALDRAPNHGPSRQAVEKLLDDSALFDEAFDALETVLRTLGANEDLASLYERRVARAQTMHERTRARLDLARVLEESLKDGHRAQRAVEEAVSDDPSDDEAIGELERLAAANGSWAKAAEGLARALDRAGGLARGDSDRTLDPAGGVAQEEARRRARGGRCAYAKALAIDPENVGDVLRAMEDIRLRAPGRERDLVETLRARARVEGDLPTKRELLREAKALAQGTVGDAELAEATLRDLLAEDDSDLWALEELTKLRAAAGDDAEVVKLSPSPRRACDRRRGGDRAQARGRACPREQAARRGSGNGALRGHPVRIGTPPIPRRPMRCENSTPMAVAIGIWQSFSVDWSMWQAPRINAQRCVSSLRSCRMIDSRAPTMPSRRCAPSWTKTRRTPRPCFACRSSTNRRGGMPS